MRAALAFGVPSSAQSWIDVEHSLHTPKASGGERGVERSEHTTLERAGDGNMKRPTRFLPATLICAIAAAAAALPHLALAQTAAGIPASISTPDKVETRTVYDNQTRSMLDTPQGYTRAGSQSFPSPAAEPDADGSTTVY